MRLLVVEDEETLAEAVVEVLQEESYAVDLALTGAAADEMMAVYDYDLVVLDWRIPPPSGIELLRKWRAEGSEVPVLMLTGMRGVEDLVDGLDTGADDYLTKPFAFAELLARVRCLLRRRGKPLHLLKAADVELERSARRVTVAGASIELPPHAVTDYSDTGTVDFSSSSQVVHCTPVLYDSLHHHISCAQKPAFLEREDL